MLARHLTREQWAAVEAAALQVSVTRSWLNSRDYSEAGRQFYAAHTGDLDQCAAVLGSYGLRAGRLRNPGRNAAVPPTPQVDETDSTATPSTSQSES